MKTSKQKTPNQKKHRSGFFSKTSIPILTSERSNEISINKNKKSKKKKTILKDDLK